MKKSVFFLIMGAITTVMASCKQINDEKISSDDLVRVNVTVNGFEINQQTRVTADDAGLAFLSFAVFNSDGIKKFNIEQKQSDENYGSISFEVKPGTYKLVAVGHAGSIANYANATITSLECVDLPQNKIKEIYCSVKEVEISSQTKNIQMEVGRITSYLKIVSTDVKPSDVASIKVTVGDTQKPEYENLFFNPSTGFMTNFGLNGHYVFSKSTTNTGETVSMYADLLLNAAECELPVKIQVLDENETLLFTHDLGEVPFKQNTKTTASGAMFGESFSPSLDFSVSWGTSINTEF